MLNFVCVNAGDYLGRGAEYVNILADMVGRNLPEKTAYKFICFTDTPDGIDSAVDIRPLPAEGLKGWWNKVALFKKGLFPENDRIIYLDLDTCIVGALDGIITYDGEFALTRDFFRPDTFQSGVMMWRSGFGAHLWDNYVAAGCPDIDGGDQVWIRNNSKPDCLQSIFPLSFVSYKVHCQRMFPKSAKAVCFHGLPRPHEFPSEWVKYVWKIGGGTALELQCVGNMAETDLIENIQNACKLPYERVKIETPHDGHAVIVGGAPSLLKAMPEIKMRADHGQTIFATNNTVSSLLLDGIVPDYQVILDGRKENAAFVGNVPCMLASQCHPAVFEAAKENPITIWHSFADGLQEIVNDDSAFIGAGLSSVGLKAIALAFTMGYRKIHIYGMDSSYTDGKHHAYPQSLNDGERVIDVECNGKKYTCAPWMAVQVEEFKSLAALLVAEGVILTVNGEGLLPDVTRLLGKAPPEYGEIEQRDGLWWPANDYICHQAMQTADEDINLILPFCKEKKVAIQAGGNVGVWPKRLAKEFEAVYTFEPDPVNYECLKRNVPEDNVVMFNGGLGDTTGYVGMKLGTNNCGAHRIEGEGEVCIFRIDAFYLKQCDLIQLDIEGYELQALKGAIETIQKFKPVIVIEENGLCENYGVKSGDTEKWLIEQGYQVAARNKRDIIFICNNQPKGV